VLTLGIVVIGTSIMAALRSRGGSDATDNVDERNDSGARRGVPVTSALATTAMVLLMVVAAGPAHVVAQQLESDAYAWRADTFVRAVEAPNVVPNAPAELAAQPETATA